MRQTPGNLWNLLCSRHGAIEPPTVDPDILQPPLLVLLQHVEDSGDLLCVMKDELLQFGPSGLLLLGEHQHEKSLKLKSGNSAEPTKLGCLHPRERSGKHIGGNHGDVTVDLELRQPQAGRVSDPGEQPGPGQV